mmetsp:Transcript_22444/g.34720  ORF Transcript_22444/g.34720 Transcript_22444/m.34720 type:complete len:129 (+) Transcript_22444:548-934(+)
MGVGFGYPFVKVLFGPKIYSYTHYPIVSNDMLKVVETGAAQFNNKGNIAKNPVMRQVKMVYYRILILFYKVCGMAADQVAANSSWTRGHMDALWGGKIQTIYPPCDTSEFEQRISNEAERSNTMISFA